MPNLLHGYRHATQLVAMLFILVVDALCIIGLCLTRLLPGEKRGMLMATSFAQATGG